MLDLAIAFVVSNIWTIGFLFAALYNFYLRREHTPIIHTALITAAIFAIAHIIFIQYISKVEDRLSIHYLYLASSAFALALAVFINNKRKGFVFYWQLKLIIALMFIECFVTVCIHIDRNIYALNGAIIPNADRDNSWWLWSLRNILSHVNNIVMLISLFLPVSLTYRIRNYNEITQTNASNIYPLNAPNQPRVVQLKTKVGHRNLTAETYIKEIDNAYNRVEGIQDLIDAMEPSEAKETANQFAYTASELITRQDHSKTDFMKSIDLLCDNARDYAIYIEKQNEANAAKKPELQESPLVSLRTKGKKDKEIGGSL